MTGRAAEWIAMAAGVALAVALIGRAEPSSSIEGRVTSVEEGPMEGVLVSAKPGTSTLTVTVVSDEGLVQYEERFKEHLDSTSAGGFAALAVLWDALERAGAADRKKLRDAIAATQLKTGDRMYMQLRGAKFAPSGYSPADTVVPPQRVTR